MAAAIKQLSIIAAVSGSYRRGGLDLSSGKMVVVASDTLTKQNLKSLEDDPRVTMTEAKAGDKSKASEDAKRIDGEFKASKLEADDVLKPFKKAFDDAKKAGGKTKTPEQIEAIQATKAAFETAKSVHADAVAEAKTTADDERKQLGIKT